MDDETNGNGKGKMDMGLRTDWAQARSAMNEAIRNAALAPKPGQLQGTLAAIQVDIGVLQGRELQRIADAVNDLTDAVWQSPEAQRHRP